MTYLVSLKHTAVLVQNKSLTVLLLFMCTAASLDCEVKDDGAPPTFRAGNPT